MDYWKLFWKGPDNAIKYLQEQIELHMAIALRLRSIDGANVTGRSRIEDAELESSSTEEDEFVDLLPQIRRACVSDNGFWLLQELKFKVWLGKSSSILWIHGPPGFGKTFLAGSVVSTLRKHSKNNAAGRTTLVGHAFFG